jgi:hypothetical protein
MIEVYANTERTEFLLTTSCTQTDDFLVELATVLAKLPKDEGVMLGVMQAAMPIAYKLSGYRAESVREVRSLSCGHVTPGANSVIATS